MSRLALVLLTLFVLPLCAGTTQPAQFARFAEPPRKYSFDCPVDWKRDEGVSDPGAVRFSDPARSGQTYKGVIAVNGKQVPHGEVEDFAHWLLMGLKEHYQVKVISQSEVVIDGANGRRTVVEFEIKGTATKAELITLMKGDYVVNIELYTPKAAYDGYAKTFDAILRSFKISE